MAHHTTSTLPNWYPDTSSQVAPLLVDRMTFSSVEEQKAFMALLTAQGNLVHKMILDEYLDRADHDVETYTISPQEQTSVNLTPRYEMRGAELVWVGFEDSFHEKSFDIIRSIPNMNASDFYPEQKLNSCY